MKSEAEIHLLFTLLITMLILTTEVVGKYLSNSLALVSNAGHMVADLLTVALGLAAVWGSRKYTDVHAIWTSWQLSSTKGALSSLKTQDQQFT